MSLSSVSLQKLEVMKYANSKSAFRHGQIDSSCHFEKIDFERSWVWRTAVDWVTMINKEGHCAPL